MANNVATTPEQSSQPISPAPKPVRTNPGYIIYPEDMKDTQDRIKFSVYEIKKNAIGATPKSVQLREVTEDSGFTPISGEGPIFLPIQSGISDQNSVTWGGGEINEIQKRLVNKSLEIMGSEDLGKKMEKIIGEVSRDVKFDKEGLAGLGRLYLAEQAVGVQGLLPRVTGQVLNPNLELLFQGPTLRPFQFQFKLSPRNKFEAENVKKIIKFFKKNMAVRRVDGNLFLKAPYVFGIEYQKGKQENDTKYNIDTHPSIGKIKRCALQSCTVDYTPLGSYMTYNDDKATMVSYNISLQFQEIVPVYDKDYDDSHDIGF